jgi:hypothetical protein
VTLLLAPLLLLGHVPLDHAIHKALLLYPVMPAHTHTDHVKCNRGQHECEATLVLTVMISLGQ